MNKDAILATLIGFGVGLVIAAGVFLGPALFKDIHISLPHIGFPVTLLPKSTQKNTQPSPMPMPTALTVESPLDQAIEPKGETLISGSAAPNSVIVLEGEADETVVTATKTGAYAGKVSLNEGKNDLVVTSYSNKEVQTKTLTVYYTPENF